MKKQIRLETNALGHSIWAYVTRTRESEADLLSLGWRISGKDPNFLETSIVSGNVAKAEQLGYCIKDM